MKPQHEELVTRITDMVVDAVRSQLGVNVPDGDTDTRKVEVPEPRPGDKPDSIAAAIDHTLLKATATPDQIATLCEEAIEHGFASVCVPPCRVEQCAAILAGKSPKVCTVIGFPLGNAATAIKAAETREAVADGADEIDMVLNIGDLLAGGYQSVLEDIQAVVAAAQGRLVKVIIETAYLDDQQKRTASVLTKAGGAHFVKTSTGMAGSGATVDDVRLMREVVGPDFGVKAAGGVRDLQDAQAMLDAGATRIGTSAGVAIVQGAKSNSDY